MNLITITFDSKEWKLVPRKVSDKWLEATGLLICDEDEEFINAVLDFAPQPETLSPWMPIDEFLKAPKSGLCWIKTSEGVRITRCLTDDYKFVFCSTSSSFEIYFEEEISHVMPIIKPQPPEVE